jgi:hypothetical protein
LQAQRLLPLLLQWEWSLGCICCGHLALPGLLQQLLQQDWMPQLQPLLLLLLPCCCHCLHQLCRNQVWRQHQLVCVLSTLLVLQLQEVLLAVPACLLSSQMGSQGSW